MSLEYFVDGEALLDDLLILLNLAGDIAVVLFTKRDVRYVGLLIALYTGISERIVKRMLLTLVPARNFVMPMDTVIVMPTSFLRNLIRLRLPSHMRIFSRNFRQN